MTQTEKSPDLQQSIDFALKQGVQPLELRDMIWDIGEMKLTPNVTMELKNFLEVFTGMELIIELLLALPKADHDQITQHFLKEYCNLLILLLILDNGKV